MIKDLFRFFLLPVLPMYFGGSDSNSSSSNTTNTTTNTDKRQVVDGQGIGVSSDSSTVNITQSDYGTVASAFDFAKTNNAGLQAAAMGAFDLAKSNNAGVAKTLEQVLGLATGSLKLQSDTSKTIGDAYKTATDISAGNRSMAITMVAVVGVVAVLGGAVVLQKKKVA